MGGADPRVGALPAGLGREELLAEVRAVLDRVVPPGADVVLAVSGGPDSTALAYLVTEARPDVVACVAHVRHGLRDDAEDARVAAAHAAALGVAYHERSESVRTAGEGVEAAARAARYAALARVASRTRAAAVIAGHTADDQAETVLLNIARGAGLSGVAAMADDRPMPDAPGLRLVRPLLRVRRADVRAFVAGEGLRAVRDPTNTDPAQRRVRARTEALPALARLSGGPGDPVASLTRLAALARGDADALEALADEHARTLVVAWGPVRALPADALSALPAALAGRVVRRWLAGVRGRREGVTADAVRRVLALAPGEALHVTGGVLVSAGGGWLAAAPPDMPSLPARPLAVPGGTALPELDLVVHAEEPATSGQASLELAGLVDPRARPPAGHPPAPLAPAPPGGRPPWAVLPAGVGRLAVRSRRPGDRLRTAVGRRTVADLLVDAGVPRVARGLIPVVVDARDQPVWVAGVAVRPAGGHAQGPRLWLGPARGGPLGSPPAPSGSAGAPATRPGRAGQREE